MALSKGARPFGERSGGTFNFKVGLPQSQALYFECSPKRVRVMLNGEIVTGCRRVNILHKPGYLPVYYFPEEGL